VTLSLHTPSVICLLAVEVEYFGELSVALLVEVAEYY
jgi:hypothetical protein